MQELYEFEDKNRKRAIRRAHYYRLKKIRGNRDSWIQYQRETDASYTDDARAAAFVNTACNCSCWMCGNPRKYFKLTTKAEEQAKFLFIEGCEEADVVCRIKRNHISYNNWY